jgi:hypothetical protein
MNDALIVRIPPLIWRRATIRTGSGAAATEDGQIVEKYWPNNEIRS